MPHRQPRDHLRPRVPAAGAVLINPPAVPVGERSFLIVLRGATDGQELRLLPVALRGVSALEAQTILTAMAEQRFAISQPPSVIAEDGRIVPSKMPAQTDAPEGQPGDGKSAAEG